ncbi:MAG TPA: glycosyltransferase, partial [Gammaproteobacteria bacterium]|nr:glycosyltransferase [Gammaproteobacteria bacterium]
MSLRTDPHQPRIAIFVSTSGHSGVDRAMQHLIPALARRGYAVDLLKVRRHGPSLEEIPKNVRIIDLGSRHTYTCLPGLVRYLRHERPAAMLADKDRVNRTALLGRAIARASTRLILSSGTTISIDLAHRGALERWLQRHSMGKLYPLADKVIVTSQGVADDMARYTGLP